MSTNVSKYLRLTVAVLLLSAAANLGATQWNEPFDREVIKAADTLIRAEVVQDFPPKLRVLEVVAGERISGELTITGFSVPGYYGEDALNHLGWQRGSKLYVLLARERAGKNWMLATPTSGTGRLYEEGVVLGSFRISCAGALFREKEYRSVQAALFRALHGDSAAKSELERFARIELGREPEAFGGVGDPMKALPFFRQHAALELLATFPDLGSDIDLAPFLGSPDMQAQVSAVRALAAREGSTPMLIAVLADDRTQLVPQMVAARALRGRSLDADQRKQLADLQKSASSEDVHLCGGSIMDPRLPLDYSGVSVRQAISDLTGEAEE